MFLIDATPAAQSQERKGILKSKVEPRDSKSGSPVRSALKKRNSSSSKDFDGPRSILKPDLFDHGHDEGISSDDSNSDTGLGKTGLNSSSEKENESNNKIARPVSRIWSRNSGKSTSDDTTDESSGGREIQNIIGHEANSKRRQRDKWVTSIYLLAFV